MLLPQVTRFAPRVRLVGDDSDDSANDLMTRMDNDEIDEIED